MKGDGRNQEATLTRVESNVKRTEERETRATGVKPIHQIKKYGRLCIVLESRWRWGEKMEGWRGKTARGAEILQGRVERRDGVDERKEGK